MQRMKLKTPRIDISRHWLAMDYHTRKHLLRALAAAKRAVRLERKDYADLMEARNDDERITWQGLWQTRKGIDAMQRTISEIERMFALAELANKPTADNAVVDEFLDMVDEHEDEQARRAFA